MPVPLTQHAADKSRSSVLCLILPILVLFLNACAVQQPFRFHAKSVTKVTYDPNNCTQLPDGKFKCKDVIFTVATVEPALKQ